MKEHPILFNTEMVKAVLDGRKTQTRRVVKPQSESVQINKRFCEICKWFKEDEYGEHCGICHPLDIPNRTYTDYTQFKIKCPYGQVGDRLWVRETFWQYGSYVKTTETCNKLDRPKERFVPGGMTSNPHIIFSEPPLKPADRYHLGYHKRPSIFMPKWAARIHLEITAIRVERVQDITGAGVLDEGTPLPEPPRNAVEPMPTPDGFDKWSKEKQDEWFDGAARTTYFAQCADVDQCFKAFETLWDSINKKRGYGWDKNVWVWCVEFKVI